MNQTLKKQLSKLILKTKLPWTKCLPIALLRISTGPKKNVAVSPYEMLFGLSYLENVEELPNQETNNAFLKKYILGWFSSLSSLKNKRLLAEKSPNSSQSEKVHFKYYSSLLKRDTQEFKVQYRLFVLVNGLSSLPRSH